MRFFEFKLPAEGSDLSAVINAELEKLSAIVDQKPEIQSSINAELEKLIAMAKDASAEPVANEPVPDPAVAKPIATPPNQPPAEETKETMFDEAAAAISMTDSLVKTLMAELANVVDKAKKKAILGMLKNLVAEAKQEEFSAGKDIINQLKVSANILAAKISGTLEALKEQYDEQIKDGDPNDEDAPRRELKPPKEVNKELVDLIESIFNKPINRANSRHARKCTDESQAR